MEVVAQQQVDGQVSALLNQLPVDQSTAALLVARVQQRYEQRLADANAPVDEERKVRVAALEERLVTLTAQLRERRETVPRWTAQRAEESNRTALSTAVLSSGQHAPASEADQSMAADETRLALSSALQHCTTVSTACAEQATRQVQRAVEQANDMATQIGSTVGAVGAGCNNTATDLAIAPRGGADGRDKENSASDLAAVLRRRHEAQARAAADLCRSSTTAPFLTM